MFKQLKDQVRANFDKMAQENTTLFYVDIDRDEIWNKYIDNFSEAEKQSHMCNACKTFLRQYSGVVAIVDNKRVSIWDNVTPPDIFKESVEAIQAYLAGRPITNIFLNGWNNCGTDKNVDKELNVIWEHFYFRAPNKFVVKEDQLDSKRGAYRENRNLFKRGLDTLTLDTLDTVLELIDQGSLYRGAEFKQTIALFRTCSLDYSRLTTEEERSNYAWKAYGENPMNVTTIRNRAIGTLLIDLSEGMKGLDASVEAYEKMVAPTNYKRTTALATPAMIKAAKDKLIELGLLDSLERRYATSTDLSLDNLLFIDKSSELTDPFEELSKEAKGTTIHPKELSKVDEVTIEKFISDVLPTAKSIELYLHPEHLPKMVSLLTGENKDAPTLFKWPNVFSWNYTGGITDSIKERVKAAGGQVTGELRISLSWSNYDDLDLWVTCPDRVKIGYSSYRFPNRAANGGQLDVDMNAGGGHTRTPVENIIFPDKRLPEGKYIVQVNQFSKRETKDVGYTIQIECQGQITELVADKSPTSWDTVIEFNYSHSKGVTFDKEIDSKVAVKEKWGLKTHSFIKVKQMMLSPNYWNSAVGNKHFMFMLEGCISDEAPKPFFNEFLNTTFVENRKTFEMLADKFPVHASDEQLSGVGFSETIPGEVILRVEGKFKRLLKIKF